jgi:predicted CXXCH cytochrome family protein
MWLLTLAMMLGTAAPQPGTKPAVSTCVQCHLEQEGELQKPAKLAASDIHFIKGLSCNDCHGGDPTVGVDTGGPEDSMSKKKGYIGRPDRKAIAQLCSSCHQKLDYMRRFNPQARVDQYTEYLTSVHGKKYVAGDTKVATCIDCHGAHGIRAVKDPNSPVYAPNVASTCGRCHADKQLMASYGIPTDQVEQYSKSVHGQALIVNRDLAAPTCNNCHGNHGAQPPGVDSVANVCGQCHVSQWDLFVQSPHKKAFAEGNLPACASCHEHHSIQRTSDRMIGVEETATCVNCHDKGSPGYSAAGQMKSGLVKLQESMDKARQLLLKAERAGMEVSKPMYELNEGKDRLVRARVEIHKFSPAALAPTLEEGYKVAAVSEQSGIKALDDLAYRRKGLAVSVIIILCMIGLLLFKIRKMGS